MYIDDIYKKKSCMVIPANSICGVFMLGLKYVQSG